MLVHISDAIRVTVHPRQSRAAGAELYASLFDVHGFELGFTSGGRWIHDGRQMRDLIGEFGPSGYWSQQDIWIGRDGRMMRRAIHGHYLQQRVRSRN